MQLSRRPVEAWRSWSLLRGYGATRGDALRGALRFLLTGDTGKRPIKADRLLRLNHGAFGLSGRLEDTPEVQQRLAAQRRERASADY